MQPEMVYIAIVQQPMAALDGEGTHLNVFASEVDAHKWVDKILNSYGILDGKYDDECPLNWSVTRHPIMPEAHDHDQQQEAEGDDEPETKNTMYILTRHHLEDGGDSFMTAAFTSLEKARKSMRVEVATAVGCFRAEGCHIDDEDVMVSDDHAVVILSHHDKDERQWHITECEVDTNDYSRPAHLD